MAACYVPGLRLWRVVRPGKHPLSGVGSSLVRQPHYAVAEPMEGLTARESEVGVLALVDLREGVEERPKVPWAELVVARHTPFMHDTGQLAGSDGSTIHSSND